MGYQILDRPAGTYAFQPGIMEQLSPLMKAGGQGISDLIYRKAAEKEGLQPSYKKDAEGNWTTSYENSKDSSLDAINKIFGLKKDMKNAAIDAESPRLTNATSYLRKAIEAGGDPEKLAGMVKPERFKYPEQQKEINSAMTTGMSLRKSESSLSKSAKDIFTPATVQKVLGALESGKALSEMTGDYMDFENRPAAETFLTNKLGPKWKEVAPDAQEILDRKWPQPNQEIPKSTVKASAPKAAAAPAPDKAVTNRIAVLRNTGWTDDRIATALKQKNIDPTKYGLRTSLK